MMEETKMRFQREGEGEGEGEGERERERERGDSGFLASPTDLPHVKWP
jgi:hypothetical protein